METPMDVKDLFKSVRELAKTLARAHLDSGLAAECLRIGRPAKGIVDIDGFEPKGTHIGAASQVP